MSSVVNVDISKFSVVKTAHLVWIKQRKNFVPRYASDYTQPYYDIMAQVYSNANCSDKLATQMFECDKKWELLMTKAIKENDKKASQSVKTEELEDWWFMTIGFNHQTWSVNKCCKVIEKILAMDWVISAKANFELHRENGEHPHCHFYLRSTLPKSKILEKCFRPLYVKEVVLDKNFIDLKKAQDYHLKYINLEKQYDKQFCVQKDIEWRQKNKIPDYEKNWPQNI